jgi:uncharacterized caspase-like protein
MNDNSTESFRTSHALRRPGEIKPMAYRLSSVLTASAAAMWLTLSPASAENRIALVIGNSSYETVSVLPNPSNDARVMTELLTAAGFELVSAPNLSLSEMRRTIGNFAQTVTGRGPDTVALVFYAGHGLQVDGENFLVPVDARIQREADVPLQALRLVDVMNMLSSVPSKTRIVILDACRNNPFSEINKTTGRGLAIVDAPSGSIVSYSTAPGTEAQDGDGSNSPYTTALVKIAREPGLPIEQALKRVRSSVHQATRNQQTPWESSSLTSDFYFFPGTGVAASSSSPSGSAVRPASATSDAGTASRRGGRSAEAWRREFRARQPEEAYALVIEEGTLDGFEAYLAVYSTPPYAPRVRSLLDRQREMIAWYQAVTANTVAALQAFLATYPNSDLAATARRLMERARNRQLASLAPVGPTCTCADPTPPRPPREKKATSPRKEKEASRPKRDKRAKRNPGFVSDEQVSRGPAPQPVGVATYSTPAVVGIPVRVRSGYPSGPVRTGGHSSGAVRTGGHASGPVRMGGHSAAAGPGRAVPVRAAPMHFGRGRRF